MATSVSAVCVFPSCTEFDRSIKAIERRFCRCCRRPLSGLTFGLGSRYRIEEFLGSGYYADVFKAIDLVSDIMYAAKVYQGEAPKRAAAERETDALQRLSHDRLPAFKEAFEDGESIFVVMELVPGPNFRQEVETHGPLTVDRAIAMWIDVCEVFEYVATQGWTYRDLHPKNIHRDTPKGTMLLDLDGSRPPHWPAQPAGRAGYRAPELEQGGKMSPACDVYSLAGCLYFALAGEDPPTDSDRLPDLGGPLASFPRLGDLLGECRRADPAQRPSVLAVRLELEPWIGQLR